LASLFLMRKPYLQLRVVEWMTVIINVAEQTDWRKLGENIAGTDSQCQGQDCKELGPHEGVEFPPLADACMDKTLLGMVASAIVHTHAESAHLKIIRLFVKIRDILC